MSESKINAKGINGQVELFRNRICIHRKGLISLLSPGLKGDKDLMISKIASVHLKNADPSGNGYIQFFLRGDKKKEERMLRWIQDDHTVIFNAGQQSLFEQIRDQVEKQMVPAPAHG